MFFTCGEGMTIHNSKQKHFVSLQNTEQYIKLKYLTPQVVHTMNTERSYICTLFLHCSNHNWKRTLTTLDNFPSVFGSLQQKWFSWHVRGMSAQHQNHWRLECVKILFLESILHVRLDSHTILFCRCPSWKRINLHHIGIEDHKDRGSL